MVSLPQLEEQAPSLPQNNIPNLNSSRLMQMNFRIKFCQGCRGPLQSSLGTDTDAPFDFCVARKERRTYKDPQTGQLCTPTRELCWSNLRGISGSLQHSIFGHFTSIPTVDVTALFCFYSFLVTMITATICNSTTASALDCIPLQQLYNSFNCNYNLNYD